MFYLLLFAFKTHGLRGGVVIGDTLTSIIGGEFDILMSEKIVAPYNFNVTIGVITHDGSYFLLPEYFEYAIPIHQSTTIYLDKRNGKSLEAI